jgi:hypothetical protein
MEGQESQPSKSHDSSPSDIKAAANATGEAANEVDGAASKVGQAAENAGDDFTRKTLEEIKAGLGGLSSGLDKLAEEIRAMRPHEDEDEDEGEHEEDAAHMDAPEVVEKSPAPPEKIKRGIRARKKNRRAARGK